MISIPEDVATQLLNYLASKPFAEVFQLIPPLSDAMAHSKMPKPPAEETTEEEKDS